jgi:hypothetical protein
MSYVDDDRYLHPRNQNDTPAPIDLVKALWRARWGELLSQEAWFSVVGPIVGVFASALCYFVVAVVGSEGAAAVLAAWLVCGWCLRLRTLRSVWLFELVGTVQGDPDGVVVRSWKPTLQLAAVTFWCAFAVDRLASRFVPARVSEAVGQDRLLTNEDLLLVTFVYGVAGLLLFWTTMMAYGTVQDFFIEPFSNQRSEERKTLAPIHAGEGWVGMAFVYGLTGAVWVPMWVVATQVGQRVMGPLGGTLAAIGAVVVTWALFVPAWLFLDLLALVAWRQIKRDRLHGG